VICYRDQKKKSLKIIQIFFSFNKKKEKKRKEKKKKKKKNGKPQDRPSHRKPAQAPPPLPEVPHRVSDRGQ